jgi:hypothetical protein
MPPMRCGASWCAASARIGDVRQSGRRTHPTARNPKVLVAPPAVRPRPALHLAGERSVAQPLPGLWRGVVQPVVAALGNRSAAAARHDPIGDPTLADAILDRMFTTPIASSCVANRSAKRRLRRTSWLDQVAIRMERSTQPTGHATPADIERNGRPTSIGMGGRH